uniref:Ion_trans domain-containing protein n=1 Tax=Macrostomum lignano TaxID=282301 RepID=A0A1I8FQB0_9PLAT
MSEREGGLFLALHVTAEVSVCLRRAEDSHRMMPNTQAAAGAAGGRAETRWYSWSARPPLAASARERTAARRVEIISQKISPQSQTLTRQPVCSSYSAAIRMMTEKRDRTNGSDLQWKETARWIKFEEDVEEGGERWSKPHVATLSLFALFEVRNSIYNETEINIESRELVKDVLLKRHLHLHERKRPGEIWAPKYAALPRLGESIRRRIWIGRRSPISRQSEACRQQPRRHRSPAARSRGTRAHCVRQQLPFDQHFMKKIPPGAETSNILVGSTDFLDHPVTAFIRLKTAVVLGDLTEVPVPTRTTCSAAWDEFLKSCTVLPPNEWDPSIRIEPPKEVPSRSLANRALYLSPVRMLFLERRLRLKWRRRRRQRHRIIWRQSVIKVRTQWRQSPAYEETCHTDPSLRITGRLFGGLVEDVKRKAPFYWSDIRDAIHVQTIGAFFFLYFACLTPIITFGGLLSDETEGYLALWSSTGPMLVFESIIFRFSKNSLGWDYLSFRMWVGLWIFLILLTVVAFDLSALVKYITRFTEESFASLIALIFIIEAFKKLRNILKAYPINPDWHPNYLPDFNCICESNLNQSKPLAQGQHLRIPSYNDSDGRYYTNHTAIVYYDWDWDKNNKLCTAQLGQWVGSGCGKFAVPDVFFFSCLLAIGTFVISYDSN